MSNAAIGRNGYPMVNLPYLGGGSGTKQYHYEMACYMLAVVTSGGNVFSGHPAMAVQSDSLVPDDHKFHAEIGLAAASSRAPRPSPSRRSSTRCSATSSRTPTRASPSRRSTTEDQADRKRRLPQGHGRGAHELAAMGLEVPVS